MLECTKKTNQKDKPKRHAKEILIKENKQIYIKFYIATRKYNTEKINTSYSLFARKCIHTDAAENIKITQTHYDTFPMALL